MFIYSTGPTPDYMHSVIYMFIYSTGPTPDYMHSVIHVHIFDWTTPWLYAFCYTCSYIRLDQPLTICILLYMFICSTGPPPDYMHSVIHVHIFDWTTPWLYAFCYIHVHIFDWTTPWLFAFCYTCSYIRLGHLLTICILLYTCSYIRLDHPLTLCILLYMFIYSTGPPPDYMHSVIHVHIFDWPTPWLYAFCYTCSYIRLDHPLTICILLHAFLFIRMVFFRFNMDILNFWANIILIYS